MQPSTSDLYASADAWADKELYSKCKFETCEDLRRHVAEALKSSATKTQLGRKLAEDFSLGFAAMHGKFRGQRVLTPVFGKPAILELVSAEMLTYEQNILPLALSDDHVASQQIAKNIHRTIHFRLGGNRDEADSSTRPIRLADDSLHFLLKCFQICHLDETVQSIWRTGGLGQWNSAVSGLVTVCGKLRKVLWQGSGQPEDSDDLAGYESELRVLLLSFYLTLTVLKRWFDQGGIDWSGKPVCIKDCALFTPALTVDALFLPIYKVERRVPFVLASLHLRNLNERDCRAIAELYAQYYDCLVDYESEVSIEHPTELALAGTLGVFLNNLQEHHSKNKDALWDFVRTDLRGAISKADALVRSLGSKREPK